MSRAQFLPIYRRERMVFLRDISEWAVALLLFCCVPQLFFWTLPAASLQDPLVVIGIIYASQLLGIALYARGLFTEDSHSGYLDQLRLDSAALYYYVWSKIALQAACIVFPMVILMAAFFPLSKIALGDVQSLLLPLALFLCGMALVLLCMVLGALLSAARGGAGLLYILLLPLALPPLWFAVAWSKDFLLAENWVSSAAFLGAYILTAMVAAPPMIVYCLKKSG